jgi:glycosyltransferase involved in cell wall biosynthesis
VKLIYLSSSTLFSKSANSLHVMKMANSFAKNVDEVHLLVRDIVKKDNPYIYYDVDESFVIENSRTNKYKILSPIIYAIKSFHYCTKEYKKDMTIFYGRDIISISFLSLIFKRVALEVHDIPTSLIKRLILKLLIKFKRLNKVVVISEALKRDFVNLTKLHEQEIIVAHDGADSHEFSKRESKSKFGYIGSVNKGRGIELILNLANEFPEKELHIIGGTRTDIRNKLNIENIPDNVICHGYISQTEIKNLIKEFYIVFAPYQSKVGVSKKGIDTSKWMSPIKLFEYMSYGKAIITSELPVLKEVIKNNYNGMFANPSNVDDWVNKINYLLDNDNVHYSIKKNAYKTLETKYTWDIRAKLILKEMER